MVENETLENVRPELHRLTVEDLKGTGLSYRAIGLRRRCSEHVVWAVAEANGLWRRWSVMADAVDRALNPPPKLVIASLIDARFPEIERWGRPARRAGLPWRPSGRDSGGRWTRSSGTRASRNGSSGLHSI